jgi:NAD(P) transhydrogenase subunit beta
MDRTAIINLAYLVASVLFIMGLKGLTHPRTAVRGNLLGAIGMLVAVVAMLASRGIVDFGEIAIGAGIGAAIGVALAVKIQMTEMPQLVAIFNGFGGGASVLVVAAELTAAIQEFHRAPEEMTSVPMAATALIGAVTFTGSLVAFAKLQELIKKNVRGLTIVNALLAAGALGLCVWMVMEPSLMAFYLLVAVGSVMGVTLVIPIGGADMPVVIALLNSYSGLAAAATGFVLGNNVLIIAGSLVGASGLILTSIMCKAMNRSLTSVLFAVFEPSGEVASADEVYAGKVKSTSADEVAMLLEGVSRVVIVPGYGLAVAQAQHAIRDLANLDGQHQPVHEHRRRRHRHRRQRRGQPGRQDRSHQPHRRHADHRRRPGAHLRRRQTQPEPGLCGYSQPAVRRRQHAHVIWRRQESRARSRTGDQRGLISCARAPR